jgi:hypothetical protein
VTHVVLDGSVAEFGTDDLENLAAKPALLGHCRVWVPVGRYLAQTWLRGWARRRRRVVLGCHGGEQHAVEDAPELLRTGERDAGQVHFARVEWKQRDGDAGCRSRRRQGRLARQLPEDATGEKTRVARRCVTVL